MNRGFPLLPLAAAALCAASAHAQTRTWGPEDVNPLTNAFTSVMSSNFQVKQFPWTFITVASCLASHINCNGANPDSPYGYAQFGNGANFTYLKSTDALVLVMQTPPPVRYYGLTTYMNTRYYPSLPSNPGTPGVVQIFESLNDTVNHKEIATAGSPTPGQVPFGQLSVTVVTADAITNAAVMKGFSALGLPSTAINQITLPYNLVPLNFGLVPTSDTYSVFMRVAYPDDPNALTDYIAKSPINVLKLSALKARPIVPLPDPSYKVPGEGVNEPVSLTQARNQLVSDLLARYGTQYTANEQIVPPTLQQTANFTCIDEAILCNGDNPDAFYTQDVLNYAPATLQDKVLIVGVNHVATGKATYISDSVVNYANNSGVVAIGNAQLDGSALRMAGITDPNDPRYAAYSQLYALTISYDCTGEPVCLQIPQPTPDNPVGIPFGAPFRITNRTYLDPVTLTRPKSGELIFERSFVLASKTVAPHAVTRSPR